MTDTNVYTEPSPPAAGAGAGTTAATTSTTTPPTTTTPTTSSTEATAGTTPTSTPPPLTTSPRPKDPRIASLHALFPDYDDLILYSVLDSVNGDQDRAIDALLGMSDPEYISVPGPEVPLEAGQQEHGTSTGLSQTELDEQFARRLMLEEQDAQQAAWIAQQEEARRPQTQRGQQQGQGQGSSSSGETMAEIQQQFGKFAETGKKTFNTFFNKVKAKIQEMDQPKTAQPSTYDPAQYEHRTAQTQAYPHVPYATRPRTQTQAQAPAPAQQPAYYDPNPRAASPPVQIQGYDATPAPASALMSKSEAANVNATPPTLNVSGTSSNDPTPLLNLNLNDTPAQQRTLTSPPIDGGKYGLLPKRTVTLLRPGEPTQMQRQHSLDESDDGLEYAESPFEEGKKSRK